jgi:hypothetical protein
VALLLLALLPGLLPGLLLVLLQLYGLPAAQQMTVLRAMGCMQRAPAAARLWMCRLSRLQGQQQQQQRQAPAGHWTLPSLCRAPHHRM